jgi:hypothetical protein
LAGDEKEWWRRYARMRLCLSAYYQLSSNPILVGKVAPVGQNERRSRFTVAGFAARVLAERPLVIQKYLKRAFKNR